ncbi:MAG: hypothetical protein HY904_05605 [Deltaproteobacteria bacterium]|nr:hypothetical protein [Deltaproteobacteria bacterium]
MFRWLKRDRHAVSTVMVALDGRQLGDAAAALMASQARMVAAEGDFPVAQEEAVRAASLLLEHAEAWESAALSGTVVEGEAAAGDEGAQVFSDLSVRYEDLPALAEPRRVLVALTVGYRGEVPDLETPVHDAEGLRRALAALLALGHRGGAGLWHLHVVPLDDDPDALLARFPELVDL